jgi:hypothetical protein
MSNAHDDKPTSAPDFGLSPEQLRQIGSRTDEALATAWQIDVMQIKAARKAMKLPSFRKGRIGWRPTPEQALFMHTLENGEFCRRFGVDYQVYRNYRIRHGLPQFRAWIPTAEQQELIGKVPDKTLARKWQICHSSVRRVRDDLGLPPVYRNKFDWTPDKDHLLGKHTDEHLAEMWGIADRTVGVRRRRLGIPSCNEASTNLHWDERMIAQLGTGSDRAIGKKLGLSTQLVWLKRHELGIPAFGRGRTKE